MHACDTVMTNGSEGASMHFFSIFSRNLPRREAPQCDNSHSCPFFENLEPRRLLSSAAAPVAAATVAPMQALAARVAPHAATLDGTYVGTAKINGAAGAGVTITISEGGWKLSARLPIQHGITIRPHFSTNGFYATSDGYMVANYNTDAGSGIIQIHGDKLTLDANINILIKSLQLHVDATRSSSAPPATSAGSGKASTKKSAVARQSTNPLVGTFDGKVTVPFIGQTFPYVISVSSKPGTSKLSLVETVTLGNLGELDLAYAVSANSRGKFTVNLGTDPAFGTLSGHFKKSIRLVTVLTVPGHPTITSTARRR
jgi:hypothetical protein